MIIIFVEHQQCHSLCILLHYECFSWTWNHNSHNFFFSSSLFYIVTYVRMMHLHASMSRKFPRYNRKKRLKRKLSKKKHMFSFKIKSEERWKKNLWNYLCRKRVQKNTIATDKKKGMQLQTIRPSRQPHSCYSSSLVNVHVRPYVYKWNVPTKISKKKKRKRYCQHGKTLLIGNFQRWAK